LLGLLARTDISVIAAKEESYTITSKIHSMTVKTQPQDTDKIPVIKKLITDYVDMKRLLAAF
jgi:BioD-like phosphotransacetylase family protein